MTIGLMSFAPRLVPERLATDHLTADTFASADGSTWRTMVRVGRQWCAGGRWTMSAAITPSSVTAPGAEGNFAGPAGVVCSMKISRPQPATIISLVALVMASTGSAIAAVDFARNAGAVDHKSAVGSGATLSHAAGKLITTQAKGAGKGTIAQKYLDVSGLARGNTSTFGQSVPVPDNSSSVPTQIGGIPGLGPLTATCADQDNTVGQGDPQTTITFANTSGD